MFSLDFLIATLQPLPQRMEEEDDIVLSARQASTHVRRGHRLSWSVRRQASGVTTAGSGRAAPYAAPSPETVTATASVIEKYPDRFLFGSDVVAPTSIDALMAVCNAYAPLWKALKPETVRKVALENYERIFDAGRREVRAWEKQNVASVEPARKSGADLPR